MIFYRYLSSLVAFLLLLVAKSEIIRYDGRVIEAVRPEYLKIPKYASNDVPNWAPGNGRSFIDLSDLSLLATCEQEIVADPSIKDSGEEDAPV